MPAPRARSAGCTAPPGDATLRPDGTNPVPGRWSPGATDAVDGGRPGRGSPRAANEPLPRAAARSRGSVGCAAMIGRRPLDPPPFDGPPWAASRLPVTDAIAAPPPFSWQHGRSLWILDREPDGWVLAELRFDVAACRYQEVRRAHYHWAREAVGALLGRAIAAGVPEAEAIAVRLSRWSATARLDA